MLNDYYKVDRLSASDIKLISESISHWLWYRKSGSTPEMEFGTAFHTAILEPKTFKKTYLVEDIDKRTKEGKERIKTLKDNSIKLLSKDNYELIEAISGNYFEHGWDFHNGIIEQPIYFDYLKTECKAKPDVLQDDLVVDFKTISDCSDSNIKYSINKYKYYIQAAFYRIATGKDNFLFIFCEKKPPFASRMVEISPALYMKGHEEIEKSISKYNKFKTTGEVGTAYSNYLMVD